jgi:excisionase family DNA binding protein
MRMLYPIPEAAQKLGIGRSKFYELVESGDLHVVKIGRRALVPHDELVRYVDHLTHPAGDDRAA